MRLGDILVARGAIGRAELERYAHGGDLRLGERLRAHTLIRSRALGQALAEQQGLPFVELPSVPCDPALFQSTALEEYLRHRYLPHRWVGQRLAVATPDPTLALKALLEQRYRCPIDLVVVSARDFSAALGALGATGLTRRARLGLRRRHPGLTADRVLLRPQILGLLLLALALLACGLLLPAESWRVLLIACNLFYVLTLAFKLQLYLQGREEARALARLDADLAARIATLDAATLPVYSILVPLYREGFAVVARLVSNLHALDYPREKLDIKLICEADDTATIAALKAARPPETMEIIRVPPSEPRTKPKACNVALPQIRGEYVVIYDAEDAPAPDQLKRAALMFAGLPGNVACLQAPLNYYNREENLLTRLFSIEYSALFRLLLPALQRLELPIPLGGTSNHLRVAALRDAGGWDAFNVTEDADLGLRLAYLGYRTRLLPSLTLEEAPIGLVGWLKQRTRWIKGYIQTWLVYMRDPRELKIRLGATGYYGFQFFVGAPALTFLLAPVFWGVFLVGTLGLLPHALPGWMVGVCSVSFVAGMASHWLFAREVIHLEQWRNMRGAMLAYPFYWLLHSLAAARALWQLVFRPHYWDKTTHGMTRLFKA